MKETYKVIILLLGFIILIILGTSIITDLIYLIWKKYPNGIIRFFIALSLVYLLGKFTSFGKEINLYINKLEEKILKRRK